MRAARFKGGFIARFDLTCANAHAHRQVKLALRGYGCIDGRLRDRKSGQDPVAGVLEQPTPIAFNRLLERGVMPRQSDPHRIWLLFPPAGRLLDVGDEKGHRSSRSILFVHQHLPRDRSLATCAEADNSPRGLNLVAGSARSVSLAPCL